MRLSDRGRLVRGLVGNPGRSSMVENGVGLGAIAEVVHWLVAWKGPEARYYSMVNIFGNNTNKFKVVLSTKSRKVDIEHQVGEQERGA